MKAIFYLSLNGVILTIRYSNYNLVKLDRLVAEIIRGFTNFFLCAEETSKEKASLSSH